MTLSQWLKNSDMTAYGFAQLMELRHSRTVYRYVNGERRPTDTAIRRIATLTAGQVTANDWIHTGNVEAGQ